MSTELLALCWTAAAVGFVHTLLGPDHYVPFIALARARGWSMRKTLAVSTACGVGHVLGSVALGVSGILLGWAVAGMERAESSRGDLAGALLLGLGIAYTVWGIRAAVRSRPHRHVHTHRDGTVHEHVHTHHREHAHLHEATVGVSGVGAATPWALFLVFVLGPCEPLIPLMMVPAARHSWAGVGLVTGVFAICTVATMVMATWIGVRGMNALPLPAMERYGHALAGMALVMCGLTIQLGL